MEMTFPLLNGSAEGAQQGSDYRALLSRAISRQAISPTATAITLAQRNLHSDTVRDDSIESRARYFAGLRSSDPLAAIPHGAFFPGSVAETVGPANYDQAVYHDGLGNRKQASVKNELSDNLTIKLGQKNRGHYD